MLSSYITPNKKVYSRTHGNSIVFTMYIKNLNMKVLIYIYICIGTEQSCFDDDHEFMIDLNLPMIMF